MAESSDPFSVSGKILETGKLLLFTQQGLDFGKNTQKLRNLTGRKRLENFESKGFGNYPF